MNCFFDYNVLKWGTDLEKEVFVQDGTQDNEEMSDRSANTEAEDGLVDEEEDIKKKEKDKPIKESAVMKPTIKISDLSDDDSMMTMTGEPRRLRAKLNLSDDEGREEKRARNKTANIPIMPQQVRGRGSM